MNSLIKYKDKFDKIKMAEINAGILTAIAAFLGVFFGSFIGPYINHRLSLRHAQKDMLFKRKLEYFERIAETLENNIKNYKIAVNQLNSNIKIKKIVETMKKNRKNFSIKSSPLYFDSRILEDKIRVFVNIEKNIFKEFENFDKNNAEDISERIEHNLRMLRAAGNNILVSMRKELLE